MIRTTLALLITLACAGPAVAAERITDFHTTVTVGSDGVMTVVERITVVVEHKKINRGIFRDIPVRYGGTTGPVVPIDIQRIERNGKPEPYHTERNGPYKRVYIGDADRKVPKGKQAYLIEYKTKQLRHFDEHDEVYWNTTGHAWAFPIEKARATVILPKGVDRSKVTHEGYVGPLHSDNQRDLTSRVDDATGHVEYAASNALPSGHGLSIVAAFPKGHVPITTPSDPIVLMGAIAMLLVAGFCGVTWFMYGRDPATGVIIPRFEPPGGMGPADVRYVDRMGYDNTCFAATLISLGVQGHLRIDEDKDGDYKLHKEDGADGSMTEAEQNVHWELFEHRKSITMQQSNHRRFSAAIDELKKKLSKLYEGELFTTNLGLTALACVLAAGSIFGTAVFGGAEGGLVLWLTIWSIAVAVLVYKVLSAWASAGMSAGRIGQAIVMTLFAIPFVAVELFVLWKVASDSSIWIIPITLAIVAVVAVYAQLIKQPSKRGRKVMDEIDGFRMYLGTGERDRMAAAVKPIGDEPERTIELFEEFLPYAIALDVENEWADQFEDVLKDVSVDPDAGSGSHHYHPRWYSGRSFNAAAIGASVAGVSAAMSAAVASASTSPSSGSSGSGGGGFSGGGGGGGGGGGW